MSFCFKCGSAIRTVYRGRRFLTLDATGDAEHWTVCAGQRKAAHKPHQKAFLLEPKPLSRQRRCIEGNQYRPQCAECPSLPWQECPCHPKEAA